MSAFSTSVSRIAGAVILAAVAGWGVYTFLLKSKEESVITYSTSDARNLKGEFTIALDSWIGYFPFTSPVFGQLMRDDGYRVKIIDDKADYPGRMKRLRAGDVDFAVCTVDSYLLNGASQKFPGAIVAVIDESRAATRWSRGRTASRTSTSSSGRPSTPSPSRRPPRASTCFGPCARISTRRRSLRSGTAWRWTARRRRSSA